MNRLWESYEKVNSISGTSQNVPDTFQPTLKKQIFWFPSCRRRMNQVEGHWINLCLHNLKQQQPVKQKYISVLMWHSNIKFSLFTREGLKWILCSTLETCTNTCLPEFASCAVKTSKIHIAFSLNQRTFTHRPHAASCCEQSDLDINVLF